MNVTPPPGTGTTTSGGTGSVPSFVFPDYNTLKNVWGLSANEAKILQNQPLVLKTGKYRANDPGSWVNGGSGAAPTNVTTFIEALDNLPPAIEAKVKGTLNIPAKPSDSGYASAVKAAFDAVVGNSGNLGNVNPSNLYNPAQVILNAEKDLTNAQKLAGLSNASLSSQSSAYNTLQSDLDQWGLGALMPQVQNMIFQTGDHIVNTNALLDWVRSTPQYAQAFPGLKQRNASLGVGAEHMTETQYQNYVAAAEGLAGQYGLPSGFINKDEIAKLVQNNVSASELEQRIVRGYAAAQNADAATKQILEKEYGITTGNLAAHFLDPTKALPMLERQTASAAIQGYAQNVGLKGFTQAGGEQLANQVNLGAGSGSGQWDINMSNVKNSLLTASRDANLMGAQPGAGAPTVNLNTLIGSQIAGFGGTTQVEAQTAVQRAEQGRAAPFEKGGGYAESAKGVVGLGSARQ